MVVTLTEQDEAVNLLGRACYEMVVEFEWTESEGAGRRLINRGVMILSQGQ